MRKIPIATRQIHTETGELLTLDYFITVETTPNGWENYGVWISEQESQTVAVAPGLTTDAGHIQDLVRKLADNAVTPTGLMDVLADWL